MENNIKEHGLNLMEYFYQAEVPLHHVPIYTGFVMSSVASSIGMPKESVLDMVNKMYTNFEETANTLQEMMDDEDNVLPFPVDKL